MSYAFRKNKKAKSWDTYYVRQYTGTALDNQVVKDKSITTYPSPKKVRWGVIRLLISCWLVGFGVTSIIILMMNL